MCVTECQVQLSGCHSEKQRGTLPCFSVPVNIESTMMHHRLLFSGEVMKSVQT